MKDILNILAIYIPINKFIITLHTCNDNHKNPGNKTMKKSLRHLPKNKRDELKIISKRIQKVEEVEKIIFGS